MHYAAKRGGIPQAIAVAIILQALRGLHAAHELHDDAGALVGLVHRDVTPQNVLVSFDGVAKIVDFGVAKATSRLSAETEAGQLKGKIAYMSPEQLKGEPVDRRSDIFAVGILLYMLTTGTHPFKGDDQGVTIKSIASDQPAKAPHRLVHGYNPALETVVMQAIAKDPAKRFASANDMFKALRGVVQPSTDEEISDFVKSLLADRVEKRKAAIRAALELADDREAGDGRVIDGHDFGRPDDIKTVIEPRAARITMDSISDASLPGARQAEVDNSLSGVAPSVNRPSEAPPFGSRRALAAMMTAAVLAAAAGVALFIMTRANAPEDPMRAGASELPALSTVSPPNAEAEVESPGDVRFSDDAEQPGSDQDAAPEGSAADAVAKPPQLRNVRNSPARDKPRPQSSAVISPVREPGF
jgi:serine/threonine-protein kinase